MKCAFGVSAGRFLGFKVHKGGILADEEKIQAMREMKTTSNIKELQRFLGKLGNIRRFVPALGELLGPLRPLLKEKEMFIWGVKQQVAFEKIKQVLTSTQTMIPPQKGKPLKVYLTVGEEAISGLVAQDENGKEKLVAYASRAMKNAELKYSVQEKYCLALVYIAQNYRHYFQAFKVEVLTREEGLKFLVQRPLMTSRVSRWALLLSEFDISLVTPTKVRSQALADLLAIFPGKAAEDINEDIPGEA